jgi:hypothetical protein
MGSDVGVAVQDVVPEAALSGQIQTRAVDIRPPIVLQVTPLDLNVVTQRFTGAPLDLMIATNVLVYYDTLDQSLALANIEAMLKPGGVFLCNNSLLELPVLRIHSIGYTTSVYSDRKDDGDHVVWYRREK